MKLLEQLAAECSTTPEFSAAESPVVFAAYMAGFRAAREMAAYQWDKVSENEKACEPHNAQLIDIARNNASRLRQLGEEEV